MDSSHTKHALEDMHINISVFRHPDHLPDRDTVTHDIMGKITGGFKNYQVGDGLKGIYGMKDDVVLYWVRLLDSLDTAWLTVAGAPREALHR